MAASVWDVFFVTTEFQVDVRILDLWVAGHDLCSATLSLIRSSALAEFDKVDEACIQAEVNDNYRLFKMLEKLLENPRQLFTECPFLLSANTITLLIEKYYDIDDSVVREISGKRPTGKLRKESDEISDRTGISIVSCRRQLDNFRRIYKFVEDAKGNLLKTIRKKFLLPIALAKKYAAAVFLANCRFELNKKRLGYLKFEDLVVCSVQMISHWSSAKGSEEELCIDREFLHDLKDVRTLIERENILKFKAAMLTNLRTQLSPAAFQHFSENFKVIFRSVVEIAIDLNHSRNFRDFFVDLTENIIIPFRATKWTKEDLTALLAEMATAGHNYYAEELKSSEMANNWQRYVEVLSGCALQIYRP